MDEWKHEFIDANGIRFHYVIAGAGPLVLLLHGFPQNWYAWRHQILPLANNFTVVALDLRGYGDSDKPLNVEDYKMDILTADVAAVIKALGAHKAHIVGHDWGGAIAWRFAQNYPDLVDKLVVINAPHPYNFRKALRSNRKQIAKSWYMLFFNLPLLPDLLFKTFPKQILKMILQGSNDNEKDISVYQNALQKPHAINAMLNYYRAAFKYHTPESTDLIPISAPTLLLWGEDDKALGKELTYNMDQLFTGPFHIEYLRNTSHWVPEAKPEYLSERLIDFLF